jgi:hypothetical protein
MRQSYHFVEAASMVRDNAADVGEVQSLFYRLARFGGLIDVPDKPPSTMEELRLIIDDDLDRRAALLERAHAAKTPEEKLEILRERLGRVERYPKDSRAALELVGQRFALAEELEEAAGRAGAEVLQIIFPMTSGGSLPKGTVFSPDYVAGYHAAKDVIELSLIPLFKWPMLIFGSACAALLFLQRSQKLLKSWFSLMEPKGIKIQIGKGGTTIEIKGSADLDGVMEHIGRLAADPNVQQLQGKSTKVVRRTGTATHGSAGKSKAKRTDVKTGEPAAGPATARRPTNSHKGKNKKKDVLP